MAETESTISPAGLIQRNAKAEAEARELRARGFTVGMSCCMKCETWISFYFEGVGEPKDWASVPCPHCGHRRSLFFHDEESLECNQKRETTEV